MRLDECSSVITIDGPAGAGKSTAARALARRLGYRLIDTGAMYRALAWSVARAGLAAEDTPDLRRHLAAVEVALDGDRVFVDGRDVSREIRTPEISELTSRLTRLAPCASARRRCSARSPQPARSSSRDATPAPWCARALM